MSKLLAEKIEVVCRLYRRQTHNIGQGKQNYILKMMILNELCREYDVKRSTVLNVMR